MKKIQLAVLSGDGIGPEVVRQAVKVVKAVCERNAYELEMQEALVGACAIDAVGDPYPDATHQLCMQSDAVLFGAIGDPRFDNNPNATVRPEQGLLKMRSRLGLYANLRPVSVFPGLETSSPLRSELLKDVDILFLRELTSGMYFGRPRGRSEDGNTAYDTCVYTREEIERMLHLAYKMAAKRRKKVTMVDKANILATSRLWRQVTRELAPQYPDIETEYLYVDNAAMRLIQWPSSFDVIVTENLFGDILTDEGAVISGSMGMLPSASIGLHTSLFEPIHGSYPQAAGKNIANPLATVLSAAMLFEYALDKQEDGALIRQAVAASLQAGVITEDLAARSGQKSVGTEQVGDWLAEWILKH